MIDLILYNGKIYTQSEPRFVSALAIVGERVVAIGNDADMLALAGAHTKRENLGGRTVLMGLTDAHVHLEQLARSLNSVDLFEVPSRAEAVARVARFVADVPTGTWVTGWGWAQGLWEGGAFPTAEELDAVAPHNPCYFTAKSAHAAWVNTQALRACGITADTPDPEGGQIVRNADGQPTGVLLETAMHLVRQHIPEPSADELADAIGRAHQLMLASGLTGAHDFDNPSCLVALQRLREQDRLHLRVLKQVNRQWIHATIEAGIRTGFGDDWLRIGNLKMFADGALGPKTALMVEPYLGEPDNVGIEVLSEEEMTEYASFASANGFASTIHAIGDRAVHHVLNVFEAVRQQERARGETLPKRHRIEHVQIIHPNDKTLLRDLQIIASMQPIHATSDWQVADRYWGAERTMWAYNARLQLDLGVVCAFGSDAPIDPFNPFKGIHAAVTRQRDGKPEGGWHPELRLTLQEALYGFSLGAAYAAGMETRLGKLDAGYLADLVVLDADIFALAPEALDTVKPVATMVGGVWRYGGLG
jgi:predicted amidohydrolase YtcJ